MVLVLALVVSANEGYKRGVAAAPDFAAAERESARAFEAMMEESREGAQRPLTREGACEGFFQDAEAIIDEERRGLALGRESSEIRR